jgi:hypothetical protein
VTKGTTTTTYNIQSFHSCKEKLFSACTFCLLSRSTTLGPHTSPPPPPHHHHSTPGLTWSVAAILLMACKARRAPGRIMKNMEPTVHIPYYILVHSTYTILYTGPQYIYHTIYWSPVHIVYYILVRSHRLQYVWSTLQTTVHIPNYVYLSRPILHIPNYIPLHTLNTPCHVPGCVQYGKIGSGYPTSVYDSNRLLLPIIRHKMALSDV